MSNAIERDFPGGLVVKSLNSQCKKTPKNKTPNARGPSLIPSQGTRSYMPQLKILSATTKTWCGQINNKFFRMPQTGQVK